MNKSLSNIFYKLKSDFFIYVLLIFSGVFFINNYYFLLNNNILGILENNKNSYGDYNVYHRAVHYYFDYPMKIYYTPVEADTRWFVYPPPSVFLFMIFAVLPLKFGALLFLLAGLIAYIISIVLLLKISTTTNNLHFNRLEYYCLIFFSLALAPLLQTLRVLQVNSIVLFISV